MNDETVTVPVWVLRRADRFYSARPFEQRELTSNPSRLSDAETADRVAKARARRREQGPYIRVVIVP